ncbi:MAG TPA: tetratricopeptide repeat protein [Geobacteraceae bacterium]
MTRGHGDVRSASCLTRQQLALATLLAALTWLIFWPAGGHGFFLMDDWQYVVENRAVLTGLSGAGVRWAFTAFHAANWHPLTWLSHMVDVQLFGLAPRGHHLTSVLLHGLNGALLLLLLARLTGSCWRSAVVAALFALHPLRVESVAWVAERKDVLSALFGLLTLLAYVRYTARPGWRPYLLALGLFALGLMAKPMLVTLPCLLLLMDWWPLGRLPGGAGQPPPASRLLLEKLPFLLLGAASCLVTLQAQQAGGAVSSLTALPFTDRLANALLSYGAYLGKAFWPSGLAVHYPLNLPLPVWRVLSAAAAVIAITLVALRQRRCRPWLAWGWCWYLVTLVPVIGLVQVGMQSMADRYTYLPLIGPAVMLVWSVPAPATNGRRFALAVGVITMLALLALLTRQQLGYWRDSVTLLRRTVAVTTDNPLAEYYLGDALYEAQAMDEALHHYTRSLLLKPYQSAVHNGLAGVYARQGDLARAAHHYEAALEINPAFFEARYNLGLLQARLGESAAAGVTLTEALRLRPASAEVHYNLAAVLSRQGRLAEAGWHYREAVRLKPDHIAAHYGLGLVAARSGDLATAQESFAAVLRLRPDHAGARQALAAIAVPAPRPAAENVPVR